eukprot:TRINITY_DN8094_c0_g1_i1.p1 TRINITY_DN8094_c0_g1~~TRINITY_DN8094_c0_g1_i1.p1  ORF type:complete len:485 (+),score=112.32 TRINITY_DN8094_c0_g1_i1:1451-2905(+)
MLRRLCVLRCLGVSWRSIKMRKHFGVKNLRMGWNKLAMYSGNGYSDDDVDDYVYNVKKRRIMIEEEEEEDYKFEKRKVREAVHFSDEEDDYKFEKRRVRETAHFSDDEEDFDFKKIHKNMIDEEWKDGNDSDEDMMFGDTDDDEAIEEMMRQDFNDDDLDKIDDDNIPDYSDPKSTTTFRLGADKASLDDHLNHLRFQSGEGAGSANDTPAGHQAGEQIVDQTDDIGGKESLDEVNNAERIDTIRRALASALEKRDSIAAAQHIVSLDNLKAATSEHIDEALNLCKNQNDAMAVGLIVDTFLKINSPHLAKQASAALHAAEGNVRAMQAIFRRIVEETSKTGTTVDLNESYNTLLSAMCKDAAANGVDQFEDVMALIDEMKQAHGLNVNHGCELEIAKLFEEWKVWKREMDELLRRGLPFRDRYELTLSGKPFSSLTLEERITEEAKISELAAELEEKHKRKKKRKHHVKRVKKRHGRSPKKPH